MSATLRSPLGTLLTHLPSRLETSRPDALELYVRAKQQGLITGRIGIPDWLPADTIPTRAPVGPRATEEGVIVVPLDFAERLWAVTFGLLVITDNIGAAAMARLGMRAETPPPLDVVVAASSAVAEAMAGPLRPWPETVPVPAHAERLSAASTHEDLAWWVGRANSVFLDALTYLALHEISHLLQRHAAQAAVAKQADADGELMRAAARAAGRSEPPPAGEELEARQSALDLEREADASARDLLLGAGVEESDLLPRGYAAVMACTASLMLAGSFRGLRQRLHPHLDVRLRQLLEALDAARAVGDATDAPPDEREALWRLAAAGMRNAAIFWGAPAPFPTDPTGVADWPRVTAMLFDHLEALRDEAG